MVLYFFGSIARFYDDDLNVVRNLTAKLIAPLCQEALQ